MPAGCRAAIAISVSCVMRFHGETAALAAEGPDAGAGESDPGASLSTGAATSTRGTRPLGPSDAVDEVCLSRHVRRRASYLGAVPSLEQAKWLWAQCQKCPDAWSKCEPCSDQTVLRTALDIAEDLRFAGDKKKANAAVAEREIATAVHGGHPDMADQLRRKQDEALEQARSQYQEAADYYAAALRVPGQPLRDEVLVGLADLYYFNLDRPDLAAEHYQKLIGTKVDAAIVTHARLMLGEIRLGKGDWLGAEQELRHASKLGGPALARLPGRGAEGGTRKLSKAVAGVKAICATYKRAWVLVSMGRAALARKVFRACARAKRQEDIVEPAAASVRRACAADERQLYPQASQPALALPRRTP